MLQILPCLLAALVAGPPAAAQRAEPADHDELSAWLAVPYRHGGSTARHIVLSFHHPGARQGKRIDWRLDLLAPTGRSVRRWRGNEPLHDGTGQRTIAWHPGRIAPGIYRLRMTAAPRGEPGAAIRQERHIVVGAGLPLAPLRMQPAMAAAEPAWDIYLGNLHSHTGHSDGGVPAAGCRSGSHPGTMAAGPADAYAFAHAHGLDFLLASEHNHMFDGEEGSDPQADPERARALYRSGLAQAEAFTAAHPGFVALYGLEWGVISKGGHLNILNSPELLGWERDSQGEVIGDTFTSKNDYAALYSLMGHRGWLGQFNHPGERQFTVAGKPLGHVAEGDAAMALCEVMNSSAFSGRIDEGETRMNSYESLCQRALEAGWHVAFSSNQDNHCTNWGASAPNRTGMLLPRGTPLTAGTLLEAVAARRMFATTDKSASLILTANGHVMGERIVNRGTLHLAVQYRAGTGRGASELVIVAGVPGRHGTPDTMTLAADHVTIVPAPGAHYFYARLTQDDGSMLWSAPIRVTQEVQPPPPGHP